MVFNVSLEMQSDSKNYVSVQDDEITELVHTIKSACDWDLKNLRLHRQLEIFIRSNLVPRAFSLAWGRGPSQGKGPGNEVVSGAHQEPELLQKAYFEPNEKMRCLF